MKPEVWTISGLAVELGRDRRTVAKIVGRLKPAGKVCGHPAWHMTDVLEALEADRRPVPAAPPEPVPPPPGFEALEKLDGLLERGFLFGHLLTAYTLPRWVAVFAAVDCKLPMDTVCRLACGTMLMAIHGVGLEMAGVMEPWTSAEEPDIYDFRYVQAINWPNLAHKAGEPDWTPPRYGIGWDEYTPEERAENILPDEPDGEPDAA